MYSKEESKIKSAICNLMKIDYIFHGHMFLYFEIKRNPESVRESLQKYKDEILEQLHIIVENKKKLGIEFSIESELIENLSK